VTSDFPAPYGVKLMVKYEAAHIEVVRLVVVDGLRGQGRGTRAMRALQKLGRTIRLTAVPERRKKNALHRFYQRLGFRPVQTNRLGEVEFSWQPKNPKS